jgi:hypothetical protein
MSRRKNVDTKFAQELEKYDDRSGVSCFIDFDLRGAGHPG